MSFEKLVLKIKKNNFLVIGRAGIDIYPHPPGTKIEDAESFDAHLGGSSANMAVELTKLGGKCTLLTRVSDDALGRLTINNLKKYKINTKNIKFQKNESRISLAIVESRVKNHQSIIYRNKAADLYLNKKDIKDSKIEKFNVIIITGTSLAAEPSRSAVLYVLKIAKKNNIPVIMDIDYRPYTWKSISEASKVYLKASSYCSGIIGNDEEFGILAKNHKRGLSLAKSLSKDKDFIIYKKGEKGSITIVENKYISKGVFKVKPLKPTGAGDAFIGAIIGALLNNHTIEKALEIGSAAAALVVTRVGCAPAMPNMDEINSFINKNNIN